MFKRFKLALLLIALLPAFAMSAHPKERNEVEKASNAEKKYQLSVCALFKNEAAYLKEWLEYHQMMGVDHFYLYDNGSNDGSRAVLQTYVDKGLVTLMHWPDRVGNRDSENATHWALSTQIPAYENAIRQFAVHDAEWLVFLDVDEFMVPVQANTILEVLEGHNEYPGVEVASTFFDASNKDTFQRRELLISNVDLTGNPGQNVQKGVTKTIFKPEKTAHFTWPPYKCHFKEGASAALLSKRELRINKYVNRNDTALTLKKVKQKLRVDSRSLTEEEKYELLETGYEIEDRESLINRFEPELCKRLGIEARRH